MVNPKDLQEVQKQFFEDPRWRFVEEILMEFIQPLLDMTTIDTSQPSEAVKAEIIGRRIAYDTMTQFLKSSKLLNHSKKEIIKSPFR